MGTAVGEVAVSEEDAVVRKAIMLCLHHQAWMPIGVAEVGEALEAVGDEVGEVEEALRSLLNLLSPECSSFGISDRRGFCICGNGHDLMVYETLMIWTL